MWYEIPGFPGYRINSAREILSLRKTNPRILRPWLDGYWRVMLRRDGKYVNCKVGVLMASVFLGPRPDGLQVCHNNGDSSDDRITNLRYDTPSANNLDQVLHGTHPESSRNCCDQGHEFTPENTMRRRSRNGNTIRKCKKCHALAMARWRAKKKVLASPIGGC